MRDPIQTALFKFQSLLLVILLTICTSAYVHHFFPSIMDRNKNGFAPLSPPFPPSTPTPVFYAGARRCYMDRAR